MIRDVLIRKVAESETRRKIIAKRNNFAANYISDLMLNVTLELNFPLITAR